MIVSSIETPSVIITCPSNERQHDLVGESTKSDLRRTFEFACDFHFVALFFLCLFVVIVPFDEND